MSPRFLSVHKKTLIWSVALYLLITTAYFIYSPGLNGLFIFDDVPNLSPLGKYKDLSNWDNFWLFILEGSSGPTGRPFSLASFYLNDHSWPSQASSFTYTNVLIHLLNGVIVFWFSLMLAKAIDLAKNQQFIFSFFATAFWLLHPMHTTTVLYIIQRMTELSATFMLIGLVFYLYGREKLSANTVSGLLILFLGVGLSLLFSILSKENGILLVAYILVIEFFLLQPLKQSPPRYFYYWLTPIVILPFLFIVIYLGLKAGRDGAFIHRNFNLTERLLTESRIVLEYLHNILLPNIGNSTLFHDDFKISTGLLTPWTTLTSVLSIIILIGIALIIRKTHPVIAFSIAWFFAGHLLESTVLPLELYFEHRNYLPIYGVFIPIAWYLSKNLQKYKVPTLALSGSILAIFAFMVMQNSILWSKPLELSISWYRAHPESERTLELYLATTKLLGTETQNKALHLKSSPSLSFVKLSQACTSNEINLDMLNSTLQVLSTQTIHSSVSPKLVDFVTTWQKGSCQNLNSEDIEHFLLEILALENTKNNPVFSHYGYYWLSEIYRKKKNFNKTMVNLDKAYTLFPNLELLKLRAGYLVSAGLYKEALEVIDDTSLLENGIRARLALRIKQQEIDSLRQSVVHIMSNKNHNHRTL